jgi:uncharacterized membrane protein
MARGTDGPPTRRLGPADSRAVAAGVGAVVGLGAALAAGAPASVAALSAWDASAVTYLGLVWPFVVGKTPEETASDAGAEDSSLPASEAVVLGAGGASLVAVAFVFAAAGHAHHGHRLALTVLGIASVALGWACVHTVYMLRYARLYFDPPVGGIGFGDESPQYLDFAYVAFTIGMTYQVSDTDLSEKALRRAAIHHALLSYLFGAVILAVAVSSVAGLLGE